MHSQNRWTGIVVVVVLGVLFSGAIVWAGSLEPSVGPPAGRFADGHLGPDL